MLIPDMLPARRLPLPARLLIADDHPLVRAGMRAMLASEPDLSVIGEAADGAEALKLCRELCPDLALLDLRMPVLDGLAATRAIRAACPAMAVIVVTIHADHGALRRAIEAGAAAFVRKDATLRHLVAAVRRVLRANGVVGTAATVPTWH